MTIQPGSADPATCPHPPEQLFIAHGGPDTAGSWSATCKPCLMTFRRGQPDLPPHVAQAVAIHLGAARVSREAPNVGSVAGPGQPWVFPPDGSARLQLVFGPRKPFVVCGLVTAIDEPTVTEFHSARTEFALTSGDHALVLSIRWYGRVLGWWDGPWQASRAVAQGMPPVLADADLPVSETTQVLLTLVNRDNGIIVGVRLVSWPARFFNAVRKAVQTQLDNGMDDAAGGREIDRWYELYPTAHDLATRRAEIVCKGGGN